MRTIAAAAVMLCLASSALAQEDCDPAELSGTWRYFQLGDITGDFGNFPFIDGCIAIMSGRGTFRSGSKCVGGDLRANLEIRPNCTIRGVIRHRFDDGGSFECGVSAAVTRDRELISGVAACESELFDPILMFNMVRR
jgi:hypothetical protein